MGETTGIEMTIKRVAVIGAAWASLLSGACSPPTEAIDKLRAYLTYENGFRENRKYQQVFRVVQGRGITLFKQESAPAHYEPGYIPVYTYRPGEMVDVANCPADSTWIQCAAKDDHQGGLGEACKFTVDVDRWKPSPMDEKKAAIAKDIAAEVRDYYRTSPPREIWLRDFNTKDPDVWIRLVTEQGKDEFRGCWFDEARSPRCRWHMFGQSPLESLRHIIMKRPLRVF
jgi:hypothetical protein